MAAAGEGGDVGDRAGAAHRAPRAQVRRAVTWVFAGLVLTLALSAQERVLTLQNLAPYARREVVAVVVPFARGEVEELPALHVPEQATVWQPFGARWPDGSLRQALCLFEAELGALAEGRVTLATGPGPELPAGELPTPAVELEFSVRRGELVERGTPVRVRDLERNALRRVELQRCRIGATGIVAEVIVTIARDQVHAYCDVALFFSDPTTEAMQIAVDEVAIASRGMALVFRHPLLFDLDQQLTEAGSRVVLLADKTIGDGQGIRRSGVLVPALNGDPVADSSSKASCVAPLLGATDWSDSGAFGAFGLVPPRPPWLGDIRSLRAHLAARHRDFATRSQQRGDPFGHGPLLQAKVAGQTGDQADFGVVKLALVADSGIPSLLLEAEASVLQEACRPVHFFAASGELIDPAEHPSWVVWSGRTHWHDKTSPDRLGKTHPQPKFESHGWTGKDRQHWSSNHLGAFALLTGAHWARRELAHEAQLYLAGQTIDPGISTSSAGAPRGAGRTELAATWIYLATGEPRLLERMNHRLDLVYWPQWTGRELADDRVRPFGVSKADPRILGGKTDYWSPWQEGLAVIGFAAAARVTQNPRARELAEALAVNLVRHGWLLDERQCVVGYGQSWQGGRPLTATELRDPGMASWSHSFNSWSIGAVEIARVVATARGDDELRVRAETILRQVRSGRRPAQDGGPDRLFDWDAVRWDPK